MPHSYAATYLEPHGSWRDRTFQPHIRLGGNDRSYSHRNAIIGFTFAARRAGIQQAINPAIAISNATAPYVAGSFVLKPKSILFTTCDAAIEMGTPIKTPIRTNFIPCAITSICT